jgi:hypothetical protein
VDAAMNDDNAVVAAEHSGDFHIQVIQSVAVFAASSSSRSRIFRVRRPSTSFA